MVNEHANVSTVQTQQQKTTIRGNMQGNTLVQLVWTGLFLVGAFLGMGILIWLRGAFVGKAIDIILVSLLSAFILWIAWNIALREHHKTKQREFFTHFYAYGESIIGDSTTHGYKHFHPSLDSAPQVKDEKNPLPDSWEQQNDRSIWTMHEREGKTWNDIVQSFDEGLGMTIQKCRTASQRHQGRITRGETYQ